MWSDEGVTTVDIIFPYPPGVRPDRQSAGSSQIVTHNSKANADRQGRKRALQAFAGALALFCCGSVRRGAGPFVRKDNRTVPLVI